MRLRALETAPFSPSVHLALALSYWNQRRYDEAIRWANKTLELDGSHGLAREFLAGAYWKLGDFDRHMAENLTHAEAHGCPPDALDGLRRAYEAGGRAGVVKLGLEQADSLPAVQLALMYGELGDLDRAIAHLERALESRDPCLVDLAVSPQWDLLRADARFGRCRDRHGACHGAGCNRAVEADVARPVLRVSPAFSTPPSRVALFCGAFHVIRMERSSSTCAIQRRQCRAQSSFIASFGRRPSGSTARSSIPTRWRSGCRRTASPARSIISDARVGGTYKMSFTNFTTGKSHSFGGEYLELVPNERLSGPTSSTIRICRARWT